MNVTNALKNQTIKDAVINLMNAWNHLDPQVIKKKCWRNILEVQNDVDENNKTVPLMILKHQWDNTLQNPISESLGLLRTLVSQLNLIFYYVLFKIH